MKNLHLFPNEKFTEPYIEFINKNFDYKEHLFLIIGKGIGAHITARENVVTISKDVKSIVLLLKEMYSCDKIFLHGLFLREIVLLLFIQPWLLKKCNWVIWGGDLYRYKYRKRTFKSDVYEKFREFVIKNMGGLITHIKGDYELAQKWYGAKGKYYYSFMYPSNLYKKYDLSHVSKDHDKIYIQIGNSANPSNNHFEVFEKLKEYKDESIEIICPLSYGNLEYRDKVIKEGEKIFGEKFTPITTFLPFEEYLGLLAKIDIAIFNHKRQQAMGNITTLLGLGKKVYIRDDITTWQFCKEHGLKVFSSNAGFSDLLQEMPKREKFSNMETVKRHFSENKLKDDWKKIFC